MHLKELEKTEEDQNTRILRILEDYKVELQRVETINTFDLRTVRPLPREDLYNYLANGEPGSPIVLFQQDFAGQGIDSRIEGMLREDVYFREVTKGREIKVVAPAEADAKPCDGLLLEKMMWHGDQFVDAWVKGDQAELDRLYQLRFMKDHIKDGADERVLAVDEVERIAN